ncbi:MAG TPA: pitrilysin family protein [Ignavibacteria bacterium]|nr:pitrilysin family protein [Ignavibacteria bacterium]
MRIFKLSKTLFLLLAVLQLAWNINVYSQYQTREYDIDGFKVIYRNTGKDVISARLFIAGGTANYPLDKEGIEAVAYSYIIKGGTTAMSKTDFLAAAEKMGTTFDSDASLDYGELNMQCLKEYWDNSWKLFTGAVLNPAYDMNEFENKKQLYISYAKQNEGDPDSRLDRLTVETSFKGKNYEKNPYGSTKSLAALTLDDIKSFLSANLCRQKAFLVVTGNISEEDLKEKVRNSFAKLPEGAPPVKEQMTKVEKPAYDIEPRKISTNYLAGIMSGIPWDSPDAIAMMVAMNMMYDKYFVELRTKRGLSYAPAAYMNGDAVTNPFSVFYITTDSPKEAIQVMVDIINNVRKNGFTNEEFAKSKGAFLTRYFMRLENASSQSLNIGRWKLRGNLDAFDNFEAMVNAVTMQDVNRVFTGNTGNIKWNYLGDETKVTPEDFKQLEKIGF